MLKIVTPSSTTCPGVVIWETLQLFWPSCPVAAALTPRASCQVENSTRSHLLIFYPARGLHASADEPSQQRVQLPGPARSFYRTSYVASGDIRTGGTTSIASLMPEPHKPLSQISHTVLPRSAFSTGCMLREPERPVRGYFWRRGWDGGAVSGLALAAQWLLRSVAMPGQSLAFQYLV